MMGLSRAHWRNSLIKIFWECIWCKKIFMGADEAALTFVSQLCIEEAIGERICEQRPGIWEMQRKACEDILDQEYETMPSTADKLGYLRSESAEKAD